MCNAELLLSYPELTPAEKAEVRAHAEVCAECHESLQQLMLLDAEMLAGFPPLSLDRASLSQIISAATRAHPAGPSPVPEILDLVGYISIIGVMVSLAWWFGLELPSKTILGWAALALLAMLWLGRRVYADSDSHV